MAHFCVSMMLSILCTFSVLTAEAAAFFLWSFHFFAFLVTGVVWFKRYRMYNYERMTFGFPWWTFSPRRLGSCVFLALIFAYAVAHYVSASEKLIDEFSDGFNARYFFGYSGGCAVITTLFFGILHFLLPVHSRHDLTSEGLGDDGKC